VNGRLWGFSRLASQLTTRDNGDGTTGQGRRNVMRLRVSIARMLAVILCFAFVFAAIRSGTKPWTQGVGVVVLFTKTAAIAGAFYARGRSRAFWGGVAIFGWQFLGTPLLPAFPTAEATPIPAWAASLAIYLHPYQETKLPGVSVSGPYQADSAPSGVVDNYYDSDRRVYGHDVGHRASYSQQAILGLANLLYAILGGVITLAMANRGAIPPRDAVEGRGVDRT
jgi:hypothetical protein